MDGEKEQKGQKGQISVDINKLGEYYANLFTLETDLYAFKLGVVSKKANQFFLDAEINLAPEQAYALHEMLGRNLKKYEEKFGKIRKIEKEENGGSKA